MVLNKASVTYTALPSFASQPAYPHLLTAFRQHLPLHNLHWKSQAAGTLRTVQELLIDLVPLEEVRDEQATQFPGSLLERPLVNLYFVQCDDNETYKTTVRKQIRDWVSLVSGRKNQDYLVVLVVRPEQRQQGGRLFQGMKSTMLDRLKSDFNSGKKDHCTQLHWSMSANEPAGWADLITKLKESIITSFDSAVSLREEEVRRSEAQRHLPGWNFCTFFVLKESLALSYEGMNLLEDALAVYDELEEAFYQVLKEMNLSWFGKLGGQDPGDDSLPLLSLSKKPYRDLMLANTITVFDIRCYLIARQCSLLGQMLKVTRLARKAGAFISRFALTLEEESKDTFPPHYLSSWQYSSALSVVDQCQAWARTVTLDTAATISLNGALAELLELARNQLDKIGLSVGHLPAVEPFVALDRPGHAHHHPRTRTSTPLPGEHGAEREEEYQGKTKITNPDLLAALDSREAFDALYVGVTKRAIECCVFSKRKRGALRLHFSLAVLDVIRGRPSAAAAAYRSLPPHYAHSQWSSLEAALLARSVACIDSLPVEERNNNEWVADVLGLMKAYVGAERVGAGEVVGGFLREGQDGGDEAKTMEAYFSELVQRLREAAEKLADDLRVTHHPALTLLVETKSARPAEGRDGSYLDVVVVNALPCEIPVDGIEVALAGVSEGDRVLFRSGTMNILPGMTTYELFCPSPNSGLYILDSSSIRLSRITFYQATSTSSDNAQTVRLPADWACTTVMASPPRTMHLDQSPRLMLTVLAGRNNLKRVTFTVADQAGGVSFDPFGAKAEPTEEAAEELEVTSDGVQVTNLKQYGEMEVIMPYYGTDRGAGISLRIDATYITEDQPELVRTLHVTQLVRVTLPMAVNVQDFFRGPNTFSKFSVTSDGQQYLRLLGAKLEGTTELYDIKRCQSLAVAPMIVSPSHQASFIFKLAGKGASTLDEARAPLRVIITYRSLWDEIRSIVSEQVKAVSEELGLREHNRWLQDRVIQQLERDGEQLERYSMTGLLQAKIPDSLWSDEVNECERGLKVANNLMDGLRKIVESLNAEPCVVPERCSLRILSIPVDVPVTQILNSVRIELPNLTDFYAGHPISAMIHISTTVTAGELSPKMFKIGFDVLADFSTWLVSGHKRGEYQVQDRTSVTVPLTLVPMRHGSLFLPQVSVYPIPTEDTQPVDGRPPALPTSDTYQSNAAETVMVLNRAARTTYMINLPSLQNEAFSVIAA